MVLPGWTDFKNGPGFVSRATFEGGIKVFPLVKVLLAQYILGSRDLLQVTNHPVHLIDDNKKNLYPTALIPFCEVGGNKSAMGVKIDQLDTSVCTSFGPKIVLDKLCYEVDPNKYIDVMIRNEEFSLTLYVSYNEDRQVLQEQKEGKDRKIIHGIPPVIIGTIGKNELMRLSIEKKKIIFIQ